MLANYDVENLKNIGISIGILLIFLLVRKIFLRYVLKFIQKLSKKARTTFFTHVFNSIEQPIGFLFIVIGLYLAVRYFPYIDQSNPYIIKVFRSLVIFSISWGLYNFASASSVMFEKLRDRFDLKMDQILIPFISKGLRFIIIAITFSIIAQEFDYDVNGFVAGLGLGGLAFALAAKDMIANFFGGIVIITERPFSIGDWIQTADVEGTVEDITFRSTRVREFTQALVTIPNATLANAVITNWSKMGKRRVTFHLGVHHDTPKQKIHTIVQQVDTFIRNHPGVHEETIFVKFDQFDVNSLDIFIYFFTKSTVWGEFLEVKEEINFKILEILEAEGVSLAYPTSTLVVDSESNSTHELSSM